MAEGDLPWIVVLDYSTVSAMPVDVTFHCKAGRRPMIAYVQSSELEDVRVHAAKAGFPKILAQTLQKLASEEGVEGCSGCERIHKLVASILKISEEAALDILDNSVREEEEGPLVADPEAIKEAMGNEKVEFDKEHQLSATRRSELKAVKEYIGRKRPKPKATMKSGLYWKAMPSETLWNVADVRSLCPVGAPLWLRRDALQGRWQMEYKRVGSKSASWGIWGGEDNAVREVVKFSWIFHQQANPHIQCTGSNCPVGGLVW